MSYGRLIPAFLPDTYCTRLTRYFHSKGTSDHPIEILTQPTVGYGPDPFRRSPDAVFSPRILFLAYDDYIHPRQSGGAGTILMDQGCALASTNSLPPSSLVKRGSNTKLLVRAAASSLPPNLLHPPPCHPGM